MNATNSKARYIADCGRNSQLRSIHTENNKTISTIQMLFHLHALCMCGVPAATRQTHNQKKNKLEHNRQCISDHYRNQESIQITSKSTSFLLYITHRCQKYGLQNSHQFHRRVLIKHNASQVQCEANYVQKDREQKKMYIPITL